MNDIGFLIKEERIKQDMKQSTLAKGICSVSYLSKIENNTSKASQEVIALLLKRLDIAIDSLETPSIEEEKKIQEDLLTIYKELTINKDKKYAKEKIKCIQDQFTSLSASSSLLIYKNLVLLRLFLTLNDKDNCGKYLKWLLSIDDRLDDFQQYLLFKLQAIYYYQNLDIKKSIFFLNKINEKNFSISLVEEADLHFISGMIYMADHEVIKAIESINTALHYFTSHFYMARAVECYICLGICYKNANWLRKAQDSYSLAIKITNELQLDQFKGIIYHNLGVLYSAQNDSEKAIEYFKKSIQHKNDDTKKIVSVLYILKELSKNGYPSHQEELKNWILFVESILNPSNIRYQEYKYHLTMFKGLLDQKFNEKNVKESLAFFKEKHDHKNFSYYSNMYGGYLYKNGQYKAAAEYFQQAYLSRVNGQ